MLRARGSVSLRDPLVLASTAKTVQTIAITRIAPTTQVQTDGGLGPIRVGSI